MKPCNGNRKHIALLVANALDAPTADKLREHIAGCTYCLDYFREISGVASRLSEARELPEIEASQRFHQKLVNRIHSTEPRANTAVTGLRLLKWRILLPVSGISALVGLAIGLFLNPSGITRRHASVNPAIAVDAAAADMSPTFANYRNAANQSLDQFDSLLTRQAKEGPPPGQMYRASAKALLQEPL